MLQWIPTLPNTFLPRKYRVGYVPRLLFNVNYSGFEKSGNGIQDADNPTASRHSKATEANTNGSLLKVHHNTR